MYSLDPSILNRYRKYAYRLFLEKLNRIVKQHCENDTVNVGKIEDTVRHLRELQDALEDTKTGRDDTKVIGDGKEVLDGIDEMYVRYYE